MKNKQNNGLVKNPLLYILVVIALVTGFQYLMAGNSVNRSQQINYTELVKEIEKGNVKDISYQPNGSVVEISGTYKKSKEVKDTTGIQFFPSPSLSVKKFTSIILPADSTISELQKLAAENKTEISIKRESSSGMWLNILISVFPLVIVGFFFFSMMNQSGGGGARGAMNFGRNKARAASKESIKVRFSDVAGAEEEKQELVEVVEFLKDPKRYTKLGARIPAGVLLEGPPGTGKTLLAKAVAGEADVPFFSISGSDFVEMFVGVGASRVRDLFKEAQKQAPCIIFIDEIDAIGKSRDSRYGGGNDEREQTLNQLLAEMDGFDSSKGLFILAATNRPEVLDKALLRPGRFDRRIIVDKPDLKGRIDTLKVHSKDVLMDDTVDLEAIGLATSGAVGSDLANMINEAAIAAVKDGRKVVSQKDLFEAVEVVIAGKEKKDRILSKEEKRTVAYHEVGHALITALKKNAEPVQKITIVPRTMGSLGYVMQVPEEEKYLMTKDELMTRLVTLLGGRAAEEVVFDTVTTGASNDIEKATQIARAMITQYGMSEKFGLMSLETVESKYLDGSARLNCSDETAAMIDDEVKELLKECFAEAKKLLSENRDVLDEIAKYLYEKETITGKQFMEIYRKVKGIPEPVDTSHMTISEKVAESVSFNEDGSYSSTVNQAPPAPWEHPQQTEAQQPSPEQTDKDVPAQNTEKEEDRNTEQ